MKRRELRDLLDRVLGWTKEKQEAAFDSLSAIENDHPIEREIAEHILRSRKCTPSLRRNAQSQCHTHQDRRRDREAS